jgi:hypothetical protein
MAKALTEARDRVSANAPRITTFTIPREKIREVIGSGGKVIREITETTRAKIDIEDDGTIKIASNDATKSQAAIDWIRVEGAPVDGETWESLPWLDEIDRPCGSCTLCGRTRYWFDEEDLCTLCSEEPMSDEPDQTEVPVSNRSVKRSFANLSAEIQAMAEIDWLMVALNEEQRDLVLQYINAKHRPSVKSPQVYKPVSSLHAEVVG